MASQFYYATKNYKKAEEAAKDMLKYIDKDNYDVLSRIYLTLGDIYMEENKLDEAVIAYKKGIDACHKIVKLFIFSFPNNSNSKYGTLISLFKGYRKATLKLKNEQLSSMLVDSIIHYQELDGQEQNRKSMLEIQARYNFERSELDVKKLQIEQLIANAQQRELQHKILSEKQRNEVLRYKQEVLQYNNLMLTNKANSEKRIAFIKSENMNKENSRLTTALAIGFTFLIILSILSYLLRKSYLKEKKSSRFKNQFYTILTHDLRGSINSITDLGKVIHYLLKEGDEVQISKVTNQLEWLGCNTTILMNNMLDWGTSQEYEGNPIIEKLNVSVLLTRLGEQYRAAIETKGIYLDITIPSVLETNTSVKYLDTIIRNILDNARKNTPQGGSINLTAKIVEETKIVQIEIKDTGNGIPEDKLYYINKILTHKINPEVGENGIGLGIILMKMYAKKIGVQIAVISKLGEGTSFKLNIPLTS